MIKQFVLPVFAFLLLSTTPAFAKNGDTDKQLRPFRESAVSGPFFENSYGYAFFPIVGKGGIGLGGAYGKGQVYVNGVQTGTSTLYKLTLGLQLGGQAFSQIIFFEDKRAYFKFVNGSFAFDASASAVLITAAAQASAGTTGTSAGVSAGPQTGEQLGGQYLNGAAVFVHTKGGLMYEAVIGGQKFKFSPL